MGEWLLHQLYLVPICFDSRIPVKYDTPQTIPVSHAIPRAAIAAREREPSKILSFKGFV